MVGKPLHQSTPTKSNRSPRPKAVSEANPYNNFKYELSKREIKGAPISKYHLKYRARHNIRDRVMATLRYT